MACALPQQVGDANKNAPSKRNHNSLFAIFDSSVSLELSRSKHAEKREIVKVGGTAIPYAHVTSLDADLEISTAI